MSEHAARSRKKQPPSIDPGLQSKLVAKFGPKIMKRGFTALPRLVQDHFRYVPGNVVQKEVVDKETGEISLVDEISYMTPTEYTIMTAIWSYWWTDGNHPWPSVEHICEQVGKSERQVRRYLQRLRDKGFMLCLEQFNAEGKQISNRYDFTPFLKRLVEFLETMEQPVELAQDQERDDKTDGERMTESAGRGCQNGQGIEEKLNPDLPEGEISDSSGPAASSKGTVVSPSSVCSSIAPVTIRNEEEKTKGTEASHEIELGRRSNRPSTEKELPGAERAKDVEGVADGRNLTPFERTAVRAGVPLALVDEIQTWLQACPRPQQHPRFIEGILTTFSQQMHNITYLQSNLTQATKLYRYAQQKGFTEDEFRVWLYEAEKRIHRPGPKIANEMAYFFVALKVELLLHIAGSQWPPLPAQPDENSALEETMRDEPEASPGQSDKELPARTPGQKEARARYARQVRHQLRQYGVIGSLEMIIDQEHSCGCPLYHGDWKCVRCCPEAHWEQDVLAFIDTILQH